MSAAETAQAFKAEGNAAFQKGKYEEAVGFFTEAIKCTPDDAVLYSNRSGAYASLNKLEEALKDAEMCVKLRPTWGKGYSRKGLAEFRMMKYKEAEATYQKGLQVDPTNEQLKEGLNQVQQQTDQFFSMQAMLAAAQAVNRHPKLAKYQQEDPEYTQRLTEILKQIQKNPQSLKLIMAQPDVRVKEGVIAAMGGDLEEEEEPQSQSAAARPARAATETVSGAKAASKENEQPAKELTEDEKEAEALKQKGNELYKQKKFAEALEAYDAAIEKNPNEILYLNNKAAVYMEMGDYDKGLAECQKALDKRYECKADFSKVAKVYCRMAACKTRAGDYGGAIAMYEKALCEDNNRATRNALNEVKKLKEKKEREDYVNPELAEQHREKGNEFFKQGDYPAAKKEYDEAIRRNPKDAKLYSNRAAALTKLCEYPSALRDADTSVQLDPTFVKGWSRKGNLHMLLKEYPKALQAFDKGLALEPTNQECIQGKMTVLNRVQQLQSSGEVDPEQMAHSLADPEIQAILKDPQMNIVLMNIQEKPDLIHEYLRDPKIKDGINKLIAAGILRVA
ncbi:similar to uniprot/P15705 Saccharomyces cerevisiae YOR027w STI1, related [Neospora caninum Liverpool]|uniref:Hsp70-Hsp90 organising protein n=1 Tax=Neospora caninum (strain Liverpool) TaxID=572307 RepID=F0V934_NEOCL|nr:similar to uniprot/P15705 Saccharomyces cerevisiae YOR027w STI1, related [Neospora caninum Liverpool]CBZ50259.1 similar to uniprot/P15705 Saccharomyces cerevisiae YOR027w STI1, related [Neospora caninum Liverpool]CEL64863.1 TPA: Similar to uniprot/P15705 Saccharomyces cerevisiae YOR027w STI1, related [Neospora caninum Liverpool]|eukprot:XP_003880293.1 similar to uniprot/P15705 Saccharomyces cerevisiae YOR027w STI1, related [Neospora caninum Liverpool]